MAANPPERQLAKPTGSVIRWLLDSDPSIRWQVMRDLTGASAEEVAPERARVPTEGAGARLLALQGADGGWGGAAWNRGWTSTMHVLMLLRELGLDPASDQARRAVGLVRDGVTWKGCGPQECDGNPFFAGEVEPCINGQVGVVGAHFGQDVRGIVDRLLAEQLPDGGWNCEAANGSTRSSFNTTICVLEALLEHELRVGSSPEVTEAAHFGHRDQLGSEHRDHADRRIVIGAKRRWAAAVSCRAWPPFVVRVLLARVGGRCGGGDRRWRRPGWGRRGSRATGSGGSWLVMMVERLP